MQLNNYILLKESGNNAGENQYIDNRENTSGKVSNFIRRKTLNVMASFKYKNQKFVLIFIKDGTDDADVDHDIDN